MRVAYLVNQYPHTSHSFIRREIAALERLGVAVQRFSIRRPSVELVDPADREESSRTRVILDDGLAGLSRAVFGRLLRSPMRFWPALACCLRSGWHSDRGLARHLVCLAEACVLADWLAQDGARHIHAHFGTNSATVAQLCAMLSGATWSFTVHGPEEFDRAEGLDLAGKAASAAFVVAISEFGRSQLFRWCRHADWGKIFVIHCAVDDAFLTAGERPVPDAGRLVCVGRLCEQKGQMILVEAVARLVRKGWNLELVLVGDGPMRPEIESLVAQHGLADRVRLPGWMSGAQVREQIAASRAFVLPSFAEGLPVVIMEALALGRPVISTYVAGIPELVEPGVNGWLVPAGSVEALADAMRQALEAPAERLESMGRAGAAKVAERHNAATEAAQLADLFRRAASAADERAAGGVACESGVAG